ncbi:MAG: aldo/keto reductase [Bacteroidota bacterium]
MSNESVLKAPLSIGTMRFGKWGVNMNTSDLQKLIEECLALGLNNFDHADIYGDYTTETDFGNVLKGNFSLRDQLEIVTKCGIKMVCDNRPDYKIKSYDSGREHIITSVENSLRNLQTDYLDILLLHRPDYLMDPHEIAEVFNELKGSGKVKNFGVSNFTTSQFHFINSFTPLVTNQVEASILHLNPFEDGTLDQCMMHSIAPMAWSPYGGGAIFSSEQDTRTDRIKKIAEPLCQKYDCGLDQLLLAWLCLHPSGIIPVLGSSKIERIKTALDATKIKLEKEDWYDLWQASTGETIA